MFDKRLYRRILTIGVAVALFSLSIFGGIACEAGTETVTVSEPATVPTASQRPTTVEVASYRPLSPSTV